MPHIQCVVNILLGTERFEARAVRYSPTPLAIDQPSNTLDVYLRTNYTLSGCVVNPKFSLAMKALIYVIPACRNEDARTLQAIVIPARPPIPNSSIPEV